MQNVNNDVGYLGIWLMNLYLGQFNFDGGFRDNVVIYKKKKCFVVRRKVVCKQYCVDIDIVEVFMEVCMYVNV